jgi:hypothetical protein
MLRSITHHTKESDMTKRHLLVAGLAILLALPPAEAKAQVAFGPQVVLFDFDDLGIGGRVDFGLAETVGIQEGLLQGLFGSFNGTYLLTEGDVTQLLFNLNAATTFDLQGTMTPYAGLGLNHYRASFSGFSSSSSGLNLLGGVFLNIGMPAFAEVQYSTTGAGFISLSFGVLFGR